MAASADLPLARPERPAHSVLASSLGNRFAHWAQFERDEERMPYLSLVRPARLSWQNPDFQPAEPLAVKSRLRHWVQNFERENFGTGYTPGGPSRQLMKDEERAKEEMLVRKRAKEENEQRRKSKSVDVAPH